jgi:hypothetical protein
VFLILSLFCLPFSFLSIQDELKSKAVSILEAFSSEASDLQGSSESESIPASKPKKPLNRPALNIAAVKDANTTKEASLLHEEESQADALLKAKRERNLKRQSMPEKSGLPSSVSDQIPN